MAYQLLHNWIFIGLVIISVAIALVAFVAVAPEEGVGNAVVSAIVALMLCVGMSIVVVTSTGWGM